MGSQVTCQCPPIQGLSPHHSEDLRLQVKRTTHDPIPCWKSRTLSSCSSTSAK